ncbi:uncharacterized protein MONOS_14232 [Monocercomonoides exilis]|uniref:uncharacterized protein n=1 Tax=Monocercomonoides exilis TaxID=2049356 RepID=UPI003559B490|nr:hypothetical protein MONOS_14232 [Monocercomonoides exilis]|eukprot:MONOS_14232.1-p1 / transcript=MONOS_14232.1 / gene=MONOS_14232 / organism=Monocercomonoides_exilis_PA203 / gene_product=unspecified product / transcript_product=unspecified product / location=Mono_scaffold00960:10816-11121(+) / protein_length=102 / sequence_SO=supercontig / SO=protein_coding / is_pseudo=false
MNAPPENEKEESTENDKLSIRTFSEVAIMLLPCGIIELRNTCAGEGDSSERMEKFYSLHLLKMEVWLEISSWENNDGMMCSSPSLSMLHGPSGPPHCLLFS